MKTIIDKESGKLLYATIMKVELQPNEIAIDELLTDNFIVPYFDFKTREFYENATAEEIEQHKIDNPII